MGRRTGRVAAAVAALLAVLVAAGCSDGPTPDESDVEPPPTALPTDDPTVSASPSPQPPSLPGPPEMVEPQGGLEAVEPHPWDEVFVVNQGRGIELRWTAPPCRLLDHIEVDYGEETVTLTLFLGQEDPDEPCEGSGVYRARRRGLDEPVGNRGLADGAEL